MMCKYNSIQTAIALFFILGSCPLINMATLVFTFFSGVGDWLRSLNEKGKFTYDYWQFIACLTLLETDVNCQHVSSFSFRLKHSKFLKHNFLGSLSFSAIVYPHP